MRIKTRSLEVYFFLNTQGKYQKCLYSHIMMWLLVLPRLTSDQPGRFAGRYVYLRCYFVSPIVELFISLPSPQPEGSVLQRSTSRGLVQKQFCRVQYGRGALVP